MNIVGKLSLVCLILVTAQGMRADDVQQQQDVTAVEKIARAVYKTIDNQKWLAAFLFAVPHIQFWSTPAMYSKPLFTYLFGGKVLLDEFTEQMKSSFEGSESKAWSKGTFLTFLAMSLLEFQINKRLVYY